MQVESWTEVTHEGVQALTRTLKFPDWRTALACVQRIGAIADAQDHHPHVELSWGRVRVFVWTHDVNGLSPRDERFARAVNEAEQAAAP